MVIVTSKDTLLREGIVAIGRLGGTGEVDGSVAVANIWLTSSAVSRKQMRSVSSSCNIYSVDGTVAAFMNL